MSLLISNVIGVYPDLVREQEMRLRRDECTTWEEANEWQLLPGHAHQETGRQRGDRGSSGGQGMKRQVVSAIGNTSRGGRRSHDGSKSSGTRRYSQIRSSSPTACHESLLVTLELMNC